VSTPHRLPPVLAVLPLGKSAGSTAINAALVLHRPVPSL